MAKIKLSETIRFGSPTRRRTFQARPQVDVELCTDSIGSGRPLDAHICLTWPGPEAIRLIDVTVHVSGTRHGGQPFVQAAEAAHGVKVSDGEAFCLPMKMTLPEGADRGIWSLNARVLLEGGAVFDTSTPFTVSKP